MSADAGSYDLFAAREDWVARAILIVSPYVERDFFRTVAADLRPERMHVVIDDGCRREDIETVREAVASCGRRRPPVLACRLGSARGLVHAKVFYVLWRTPGGRTAHSLVFGSANATRQGFGGSDNAELVASMRLTAARHAEVIRWCVAVMAATEAGGIVEIPMVRDAELAPGVALRLPAITVGRQVAGTGNFDLWLQRGLLLSDYRPDPAFLHVPIQLAKGLPQAELARVASAAGFAVRQTRKLRYRYVDTPFEEFDEDEPTEGDDRGVGNWRRKYFVWTNLGDWCSEACFDAHGNEFRRRGHEERVRALEQLTALRDPAAHAAARDGFLSALGNLWDRFGQAAPSLLRGGRALDRASYGNAFDQRVERDHELASDREFAARFLRGFELVEVPRFRNDVAGWRGFVGSLSRQLVLDAARGRSQSLLLKAVREGLRKDRAGDRAWRGHRELTDALRAMWQRTGRDLRGPAAVVARYHVPRADPPGR